MIDDGFENRISQAGVDVLRIVETSVLVKVADDVAADKLWLHPGWALCRSLAAMGFGAVHLRGAIHYFENLTDIMRATRFTQEPGAWFAESVARNVPPVDVIVDLTSDPESKRYCAALARERAIPLVSLTLGRTWASMTVWPECGNDAILNESPADVDEEPLPPISRIAAGLAVQEVLRLAAGVELAAPPDPVVTYDAVSEARKTRNSEKTWPAVDVQIAIIEVIGAGGIGVHFLECFAPMLGRGSELRIFDPDDIGPENLPLQITYTLDDVGRPKAEVMAEKLGRICQPGVLISSFPMSYQERQEGLARPSLRVSCVDNFAARLYANDLSVLDGVPLADAGSSPLAARQVTFSPGSTACLRHSIPDLDELAASEEGGAASCSLVRAPTLTGTNAVIGGILAAEALRALLPEVHGPPCAGTILYDQRFPSRFGITQVLPPCAHRGARRCTARSEEENAQSRSP